MTLKEIQELLSKEYVANNILNGGRHYAPSVIALNGSSTEAEIKTIKDFYTTSIGWDSPNGNKVRTELLRLIYK